MSLARSASGPGALSLNTNSLAPPSSQPLATGGLFGSSTGVTQATATNMTSTDGGLFGSGQQKPATGLFGSSTSTSAPATSAGGGGLFGSGAATTQTANAGTANGGSLLANANPLNQSNTTTTGTGGGLYGIGVPAATVNPPQQQTGGGLFGSTANQPKPGGLFGSTPSQPQQTSGTGGLFGSTPAPQQQASGNHGHIERVPNNTQLAQQQQQQQQTSGGLFGGSTNNQQQPSHQSGGGGFGQSQAKPTGSLFGMSQPQQASQQPQQGSVSAVRINFDNLRPRSRFDDLAPEVQQAVEQIDQHIQHVIQMKAQISEFMPQHELDIAQLGRDVTFVESKFKTVQAALNRDVQTVKALQDMTKKNLADSVPSRSAVDNLQLPTHYHQTSLFATPSSVAGRSPTDASATHAGAQDLITYFNRICDDVGRHKLRLDEYRGAIERDMPGVEHGLYEQIRTLRDRHRGAGAAGGAAVQDQLGEILAALRDTGSAIVAQAGQIAETRERLSRLQAGIVDSGVYAMSMA